MEIIKGDLLDVKEGFIIHGCNAQGVMGSGVARGVKAKFPQAYQVYRDAYERHGLPLGSLTLHVVNPRLFIVNMVTQESFGAGLQVSYPAIHAGFKELSDLADLFDPKGELPFCFPMIGAGRGGGDWETIKQEITKAVPPWINLKLYVVDVEPESCR